MRKQTSALLFGLWLLAGCSPTKQTPPPAATQPQKIAWSEWSPEVFARASREDKLVLLHLGAVWCHWCHVMEETTYKDPKVVSLIASGYIPIHADQDARPDLSSRYEDYGWPATIIFNSRGEELAKLRGYIEPARMASTLEAFIKDPTPGPSVRPEKQITAGAQPRLAPEIAAELEANYQQTYDKELGGWGTVHKFANAPFIELALQRRALEGQARQTLTAAQALIDPIWGGAYQYSDSGVWTRPHFEKIMSFQASYIKIYAEASFLLEDKSYLKTASDVARFIRGFLQSPEGAFYVSQDADIIKGEHSAEYFTKGDAARRAQGIPSIDKHLYARENGWAIEALALLYAVTDDESYLKDAKRAASWVETNRALAGGGFRHDEEDLAGPYLADTLAMGSAYLALYRVTAEHAWLDKASAAADFIKANFFVDGEPGALSSQPDKAMPSMKPLRNIEENISLARFTKLLWHHTEREEHKTIAEQTMRYLAADASITKAYSAGVLLANQELRQPPSRLIIRGEKNDANAKELFRIAKQAASLYLQIDWIDDTTNIKEIPEGKGAALFLCAERVCNELKTSAELRKSLKSSKLSEVFGPPEDAIDPDDILSELYGEPQSLGVGLNGAQEEQGLKVTEGNASITGKLDKTLIHQVIRRALPGIIGCYEQQLAKDPSLEGTIKITFTIEEDGAVSSASPASSISPKIDTCVTEKISRLSFPRPKSGTVTVTYPFTFSTK